MSALKTLPAVRTGQAGVCARACAWAARALALAVALAHAQAEVPASHGAAGGVTKVAVPENWFPISYRNDAGEPAGFAPDFARAMAKAQGWNLEIVLTPDDYTQPLPAGGVGAKADVRFTQQVAPTTGPVPPYVIELDGAMFVRRGDVMKYDTISNINALQASVAVVSHWAEAYAKTCNVQKALQKFLPAEEALRRLDAGDQGVDVVFMPATIGSGLVQKMGLKNVEKGVQLRHFNQRYTFEPAPGKGGDGFGARLNAAITQVNESGAASRIRQNYHLTGLTAPITGGDVARAISAMLLLILVLTLVMLGQQFWARRKMSLQAQELRHQQIILSAAQDLAGVGHWQRVDGGDEAPVRLSEQICRILGLPPQAGGRTTKTDDFLSLIHPEDRVPLRQAMFTAQNTLRPVTLTHRLVRPSGELRTVDHCVQYVADEGRPLTLVGTMQDITERLRTEEARRNQEQLLHEAGQIAKVGGWSFDPITGEGHWTPEVAAIHEVPAGQYTSREVGLSFIQGTHRERIEAAITEAQEHGVPYDIEFEIITAKGNRRWVRSICNPVMEGGRVVRLRGCIQDISDQKQAAEALRRSDDVLNKLASQVPGLIYIFRRDGAGHVTMPFASRSMQDFFEVSAEDAQADAASVFVRILPQDFPHVQAAIDESANTMTRFRSEYRVQLPLRGLRWHCAESVPERQADGSIIWYGHVTDLTESKLAQARIAEQAALLERAQDAIVVRDLEHRVLYWNNGAANLYGWTAEEALGRNITELIYPASGLPKEANQAVHDCGEWNGEVEQMTKDGRDLVVQARWTLNHDEDGKPVSILAINTDITENKRLQARTIRSQRLESIGTLASGVAHDLNNVLAPITLAVSLLRDKATDPMTSKTLDIIDTAALRGASVIKQIIGFARGSTVDRVPVQLDSLLADHAALCRQTFPMGITIEHQINDDAWTMLGDAVKLEQMLTQLCANAKDAMPEGVGTLTLSLTNHWLEPEAATLHPGANPGPYLLLEVADTGIGIAPEALPRIFDPFYTSKDIGRGSGLGLTTVMGIVRGHGGFVDVSSHLGKGTTFQIYLPASEASPLPLDLVLEPSTAAPRGNGQTLLLVDDEAPLRQLMEQILIKHGYNVITAADGIEALALYAREHRQVALVITDMAMPRMGGEGTIRAIRRIKVDIPVIAISGNRDPATVAHIAPGLHFLSKPFATEKFLHLVAKALGIETE